MGIFSKTYNGGIKYQQVLVKPMELSELRILAFFHNNAFIITLLLLPFRNKAWYDIL